MASRWWEYNVLYKFQVPGLTEDGYKLYPINMIISLSLTLKSTC